MKKIENVDNCLTYSYQDKNNEIITCKIANYAIQGLFVIKLITNTKNTYKVIEKLALWVIKEQQSQKRYIKIIEGNDETDFSTFFKTIHHGIVGLYENFNKQKFLLLIQMLYENLKSIEIYTNFGYQSSENSYIIGNSKIQIDTKTIEKYPKIPDDLQLTEEEKLQILPANDVVPKLVISNIQKKFSKNLLWR